MMPGYTDVRYEKEKKFCRSVQSLRRMASRQRIIEDTPVQGLEAHDKRAVSEIRSGQRQSLSCSGLQSVSIKKLISCAGTGLLR